MGYVNPSGTADPAKFQPLEEKSERLDQDVEAKSETKRAIALAINRVWKVCLAVLCSVVVIISFMSRSFGFAELNEPRGFLGSNAPEDTICLTPTCVQTASGIIDMLDPEYEKIDACTDFDQLVCGGFNQRHDIRPDQRGISPIIVMSETSKMMLRHILEGPQLSSINYNEDNFAKLKAAYNSCMDEKSIKDLGLQPLEDIIKGVEDIYPGDPSLKPQVQRPRQGSQIPLRGEPSSSLSEVIEYLATFDVNTFIQFEVTSDDRDPDSTVLFIYGQSPSLPSKEYYEDKTILKAYREVTSRVLGDILNTFSIRASSPGSHPGHVTHGYDKLVDSVIDLEVELAKASPPAEEQEDVRKYYNPRSLKEAQSLIPQISLDKIIANLNPSGRVPDRMIVTSPSYLNTTSTLLENTSEDVVQAFLIWKAIQRYESAVEDQVLEPWKQFVKTIRGQDPNAKRERWQTCIDAADSQLGWILSKYFIDAAFSEASKNFGDQIIHDIKTSFILTLNSTTWMSPSVRSHAINKVNNIIQKIGYPTKYPDIRNSTSLQDYYASLPITNSTGYFTNIFNSAAFEVKRGWSALGLPTNRDEWEMTAPTVNAYYNPPGNEIVFPAGIMQTPVFYDPSVPKYLSYGAFGSVAGHELSHAFDSNGRLYDETGNYTDWWDEATITAFQAKAQCFVDQYSRFTLPLDPQIHVNGRLTLGENIADAGGVAAAFAAWKRHEATEYSDQLLPGLSQSFSKEQLFFVSYAGFWCGQARREYQREMALRDPHSPGWARIRGTLNNSREFREAFGCEVKEETCKLW